MYNLADFLDSENRNVVAVDLDNTLTQGENVFWGDDEPKPNQKMIDYVEDLYKQGNVVIIHTARNHDYRDETEAWLRKHNVWHHALVMGKLGADVYIDDKAVNADDIDC